MSHEHHDSHDHKEHGHDRQSQEHHADHREHKKHEDKDLENKTLMKLADNISPLVGGHHCHPHHHHHIAFKRPEKLTNQLAFYSLRKLSTLDHSFPQSDKRALAPQSPGILSWLTTLTTASIATLWGAYVYRSAGFRGYLGKGGIVFAGLIATHFITARFASQIREKLKWPRRQRIIDYYITKYGESYLLDVLEPSFTVHHAHH